MSKTCRDTVNMSFLFIGNSIFNTIMLLLQTFHIDYTYFSSGLVHS